MNNTSKQKVSEVFAKYKFSPEDAQFIADVLSEIDDRQRIELEAKLDDLLGQKDKTDLLEKIQDVRGELLEKIQGLKSSLTVQIYVVGLIQFLAIVGSVIGIVNYMLK